MNAWESQLTRMLESAISFDVYVDFKTCFRLKISFWFLLWVLHLMFVIRDEISNQIGSFPMRRLIGRTSQRVLSLVNVLDFETPISQNYLFDFILLQPKWLFFNCNNEFNTENQGNAKNARTVQLLRSANYLLPRTARLISSFNVPRKSHQFLELLSK